MYQDISFQRALTKRIVKITLDHRYGASKGLRVSLLSPGNVHSWHLTAFEYLAGWSRSGIAKKLLRKHTQHTQMKHYRCSGETFLSGGPAASLYFFSRDGGTSDKQKPCQQIIVFNFKRSIEQQIGWRVNS